MMLKKKYTFSCRKNLEALHLMNPTFLKLVILNLVQLKVANA
jgi:hypothetical protein